MEKKQFLNPELDVSIVDLTVNDLLLEIHPDIPSLPTNVIFYGKSSAGKSNVILNLLKFYKKQFKNKTIVFTKTNNGSLMTLKTSHNAIIYNEINDEFGQNRIKKILDFQKALKDDGKTPKHIIIILDDFITDASLNKKGSIFEHLFAFGRHSNVTTFLTSQSFKQVPAVLRRLSWNDIIYSMSNTVEKNLMCFELCNSISKTEREFEAIYKECVEEPYSFMYLDKRKGNWSKRFGK